MNKLKYVLAWITAYLLILLITVDDGAVGMLAAIVIYVAIVLVFNFLQLYSRRK